MRIHRFATLLLLGCALACSQDATAPDPAKLTYDPSLGIDITQMTHTASGLYYQDVTVGSGTAASAGSTVHALYSGWLHDGTLFGAAEDPNDPLIFRLGVGEVIKGWDEGVAGMREGGERKLVIPPALGYGNRANGPIPANSTLVFRIQIISVQLPMRAPNVGIHCGGG